MVTPPGPWTKTSNKHKFAFHQKRRNFNLCVFVAVFLGCTSTGRVGLCFFLWFYVQELQKAQPAVVLVLKRLRRRGNGLKSHPTDWDLCLPLVPKYHVLDHGEAFYCHVKLKIAIERGLYVGK